MAIYQQKVREVVSRAVSKQVDIPEFQREFIWDPEQVKLLAESLYRNYPIGSFLLWNCSAYQEAKTAQGAEVSVWIVDGQQRTTALCLLLGQKSYWWPDARDWNEALERHDIMVNILSNDDERLEFARANPVRSRDPAWVGLREILEVTDSGDLVDIEDKILSRVAQEQITSELRKKVRARLQRLWQIRERDIPIVEIEHEVEDVAEIFARLNQAGTRVKEADVVLALAAVRNPGWVREEYLPFRDDLEDRGWDLDAGIYVRTITGIHVRRARLIEVSKDFWSSERFPSAWKIAKQVIREVIKQLQQYGLLSVSLLPSANSLIPLFVLHAKFNKTQEYHFSQAFSWFLRANWDGRYSGSAITSLNEDVRAIHSARSFPEAISRLSDKLRVTAELLADDFLVRYDRAGNRFQRLLLYLLLFKEGATDWADGTQIGYDTTQNRLNEGFEPQWHHIFPRSVLKRQKRSNDDIHILANITILTSATNCSRLNRRPPHEYIPEFKIPRDSLQRHVIPQTFTVPYNEIAQAWDVKHYDDFLLARAELLAGKANEFFGELVTDKDEI